MLPSFTITAPNGPPWSERTLWRESWMARAMKGLSTVSLPNSRIFWFQFLVNEVATPIIGQERAFHRVNRDLFEVTKSQAKGARGGFKFLRHRRVTHEPVISV